MKASTCHSKLGIEGNRNVDQLAARTIVADACLRLKKIMDAYDTYYALIRRLMTFLGVWPHQDPKEHFVRTVLVVSIIISMILVEIFTLINTDHNLDKLVQVLTVVLASLAFSTAYYACLAHFNGIKLVFDRMLYDWAHLKNLEELEIMREYASQTRRYTLIFAIIMYSSCFFIVSPSIFKIFLYSVGIVSDFKNLNLPLDLEYFLDKNKYFYIMMLHQTVSIPVLFTCAIAIYSMFFMIIQHACGSFRVISRHQNTDQWIFGCIERYNNVIEFIDITNKSGEMACLWQIGLAMSLVSLAILRIFQMRTYSDNLIELLFNGSCIPGPIAVMFISCFVGQKVINHNTDVFLAACQLPYYNTSLKMQKLLLFLIMRTAKPCTLSIGKMFIFSHEFFSAVIQTSFSYAMMLYTFQ